MHPYVHSGINKAISSRGCLKAHLCKHFSPEYIYIYIHTYKYTCMYACVFLFLDFLEQKPYIIINRHFGMASATGCKSFVNILRKSSRNWFKKISKLATEIFNILVAEQSHGMPFIHNICLNCQISLEICTQHGWYWCALCKISKWFNNSAINGHTILLDLSLGWVWGCISSAVTACSADACFTMDFFFHSPNFVWFTCDIVCTSCDWSLQTFACAIYQQHSQYTGEIWCNIIPGFEA